MAEVSVAELNELDRDGFVERVGFAFEDSPWIAGGAWDARPFESVDQMHAAMVGVVAGAGRERQEELIRAHPDLAGRAALAGELTPASSAEQASAGLDRLRPRPTPGSPPRPRPTGERFGFPFVVCVREHTPRASSGRGDAARLRPRRGGAHGARRDREDRRAATAGRRGEDGRVDTLPTWTTRSPTGRRGARVPALRDAARGPCPVPESPFTGRANSLFAHEITVEVFGDNFLPSYTRGDNSNVVATDSMKNFILRRGPTYEGATLEGYLDHLGGGLLEQVRADAGLRVPGASCRSARTSRRPPTSAGAATTRRPSSATSATDGGWRIASHSCGRLGLRAPEDEGQRVRALRARRVHDAAGAHRPPAVHPP